MCSDSYSSSGLKGDNESYNGLVIKLVRIGLGNYSQQQSYILIERMTL